jgi:poly-gamma-glutamate synthesis protein (capsule biosynthesis protein)
MVGVAGSLVIVAVIVAVVVAIVVAILAGMAAAPSAAPGPSDAQAAVSSAETGTSAPDADGAGSAPSPSPTSVSAVPATPPPSALHEPTAEPTTPVVLVPVVGNWSSQREISRADLAASLGGSTGRTVIVAAADLPALAAALGVAPSKATRAAPAADVLAAVASSPDAIGVIRAADVTADVRALAIDGRSLFGAERIKTLADWPLMVDGAAAARGAAFDPSAMWTLVAGGDVMLDRAVYRESVLAGKGADFPWDGGTAAIGGYTCCGWKGARLPVGRRSGEGGAVRELLRSADVALVNLEGPAPDDFRYHPHGLVFTFDPALLVGLQGAGIDVVSLANNHISNAGSRGIADTVRHLDELGLAHAGAGSDITVARRPALLDVGELRIAILAYDGIRPDLVATSDRAGAAPLRRSLATADIRAARAAGADVVIVMPHWGVEYSDSISRAQRVEAAALVAAGADAVIGSHSHWPGPIESIDGRPVLYSLGDLVFTLTHDERTMEGVIADLTFVGRQVVQVDLHPTLILDGSQPNLLDPGGDGAQVLERIETASNRLAVR